MNSPVSPHFAVLCLLLVVSFMASAVDVRAHQPVGVGVREGISEESWEEGWESSPVGIYHPYIPGYGNPDLKTKISGDTGDWYVEDTISASGIDHPEYDEWSPNCAEIEETPDGQRLAMTITYINGSLSDLFVARRVLLIPLNENTSLSFTLHGSGFGVKGLVLSPIGGKSICYSIHGTPSKGMGDNIQLEGDGGTYTRNIFDDYTNILGHEYEGTEEINRIYLFVQDLVSDGLGTAIFDDIHMVYTRPSESPSVTEIESCDLYGAAKDHFDSGETVYVTGSGFFPSSTLDFYLVDDVGVWMDGMPIPARIPDTVTTVVSSAFGDIPPTAVWVSPQTIGAFDLIVDVDGDGIYLEGEDALDDGDVGESAGFAIPEFPSMLVLPLLMALSLGVVLLSKKKSLRGKNSRQFDLGCSLHATQTSYEK